MTGVASQMSLAIVFHKRLPAALSNNYTLSRLTQEFTQVVAVPHMATWDSKPNEANARLEDHIAPCLIRA